MQDLWTLYFYFGIKVGRDRCILKDEHLAVRVEYMQIEQVEAGAVCFAIVKDRADWDRFYANEIASLVQRGREFRSQRDSDRDTDFGASDDEEDEDEM